MYFFWTSVSFSAQILNLKEHILCWANRVRSIRFNRPIWHHVSRGVGRGSRSGTSITIDLFQSDSKTRRQRSKTARTRLPSRKSAACHQNLLLTIIISLVNQSTFFHSVYFIHNGRGAVKADVECFVVNLTLLLESLPPCHQT